MSTAASAPDEAIDVPADAAPVLQLAQRDGAIALAALSIWAAADAWHATTGLALASLLSLANGIAAGILLDRLGHEWGHFAGARWGGGIAPTLPIASFFPIFNLDMERSPHAAFRAMSVGGNVGHWLVVLLLVTFIPLDTAGRLALVSSAFGYAVFASLTEFPVIRRAFAGAAPAESFKGLTGAVLKRNRWLGAGAGLLLFLVL
ncbi:MAG: hypothetical protein HRU01_09920 [Myxococcales bacterium]|nr:hypothetical protein [Myxococcales bacterium]